MSSNLAKAAFGALALNGGGGGGGGGENNNAPNNNNNNEGVYNPVHDSDGNMGPLPECPNPALAHFHAEDVCSTRNVRLQQGHVERESIYQRLKNSGTGATLVPNQQTVICPLEVQSLEIPSAVKGLDTTWIVENKGSLPVMVSWVVNGVEWSPFRPDVKPVDDPQTIVQPGDWLNVPTFDSFVYHIREMEEDGTAAGRILLQHRVGLIPIGNPRSVACDATQPDVEPINPETAELEHEYFRFPTPPKRPCNTVDIAFRNQVGCPLQVYWANRLETDDVPREGFQCGEQFRFHLGTKPATQDFMLDWESATKFEGSYIGHTFVARLASDPNIVIDSYTIDTTKVIDCPNSKKQTVVTSSSEKEAEVVVSIEGIVLPLEEEEPAAAAAVGAWVDAGGASF